MPRLVKLDPLAEAIVRRQMLARGASFNRVINDALRESEHRQRPTPAEGYGDLAELVREREILELDERTARRERQNRRLMRAIQAQSLLMLVVTLLVVVFSQF